MVDSNQAISVITLNVIDLNALIRKRLSGWVKKQDPILCRVGLTGLISLQSKGLSRVFANTTVQKFQFFGTQLSSQSNSHIHT